MDLVRVAEHRPLLEIERGHDEEHAEVDPGEAQGQEGAAVIPGEMLEQVGGEHEVVSPERRQQLERSTDVDRVVDGPLERRDVRRVRLDAVDPGRPPRGIERRAGVARAGDVQVFSEQHPVLAESDADVQDALRLDPDHEHTKNFFDDFEIDSNLVSRTKGITILYSDDDQESVLKTVEIIRQKVNGITYKEFHNYRHFCIEDMKTVEFPELLQIILD